MPAVLKSVNESKVPISNALQIWRHTYEAGRAQNPLIVLASAGSLAFCAWTTRDVNFGFSSAATLSIVPYTVVVMTKTLDRLVEMAKKAEKEGLSTKETVEAEQLLRRWVGLNGVRSFFPLIGAVIAISAIL